METIPRVIAATGVLAAISCTASIAGIALLVYLKGYKHFLYRLTLHLAFASFMRSLFIGLSVIPVDVALSNDTDIVPLPGTDGLCAFIGGIRQYTYLWCAAAIMWACLYVIKKGCWVSQKRGYDDITDSKENKWILLIKRHKYEIAGHLTAALVPSLVFWIPYIQRAYGLNGPWCWIHEYDGDHGGNGLFAFRIVFRLPVIIGSLTCVLLMSYILGKYCRKARLQDDHWQLIAARKVAPIMIYPIFFALASVASILHPIVERALHSTNTDAVNEIEMVFLTVFFIYDMSIPLSLFLHKEIRVSLSHRCACGRLGGEGRINPDHTSMADEDEDKQLFA